jgi:hypothetical protein
VCIKKYAKNKLIYFKNKMDKVLPKLRFLKNFLASPNAVSQNTNVTPRIENSSQEHNGQGGELPSISFQVDETQSSESPTIDNENPQPANLTSPSRILRGHRSNNARINTNK